MFELAEKEAGCEGLTPWGMLTAALGPGGGDLGAEVAMASVHRMRLFQPDAPGGHRGGIPGAAWPDVGDWQVGHEGRVH